MLFFLFLRARVAYWNMHQKNSAAQRWGRRGLYCSLFTVNGFLYYIATINIPSIPVYIGNPIVHWHPNVCAKNITWRRQQCVREGYFTFVAWCLNNTDFNNSMYVRHYLESRMPSVRSRWSKHHNYLVLYIFRATVLHSQHLTPIFKQFFFVNECSDTFRP